MKAPKVILLAARGEIELPGKTKSPFHTSLEWIIHSFKENGVPMGNIVIVGGRQIETLSEKYPEVKFIFNPDWEETGTMHSLSLAREYMGGDCIVSYADVVYRPGLIKKLLKEKRGDICPVIDTSWKNRYPNRSEDSLLKAEKLWTDEKGNVAKAQRKIIGETASGELAAGLVYLTPKGAKKMLGVFEKIPKDKKFHEALCGARAIFMDIFTELICKGEVISSISVEGQWAEMDEPQDFGRFIFGTKSQTLERLKPMLKNGVILPQVNFTVGEWKKSPDGVLEKIKSALKDKNVIVRSSTAREDSFESSFAGAFTSVLGVKLEDKKSLAKAINKVIGSFGQRPKPDEQILVQPMVKNIDISGVLFTCDIKTGAPYFVINFDNSGKTDSVTSGRGKNSLHCIYKWKETGTADKRLDRLVACAKELESLTGNEALDIEFAIDREERLFIFQSRPITNADAIRNYYSFDTLPCMERAEDIVEKRLTRKPHISGGTTVLGDMPDWNPAELIGSLPHPLASSLFEKLIARDAWRIARKILGYFDPSPERLMVMIAGHPYIDVRNSLNSFTPAKLKDKIREKIVNECLDYLKANPSSHDKLEFEVALTCFTPFVKSRIKRWQKAGFSADEINEFKSALKEHTEKMIRGDFHSVKNLISKVESLDARRKELLKHQSGMRTEDIINFLIDDCRELGTIPFSSLARFAFIGNTFLKSFKETKAISEKSYHGFLNSITTVAGEMGNALENVKNGAMSLEDFLKTYGHLRPGTFEIASFRYDEKPELYFSGIYSHRNKTKPKPKTGTVFEWKQSESNAMQKALDVSGIGLNINEVLEFAKDSIRGRELAKFIFSRNVSDLLSLIVKWGKERGVSREDLSFLHLSQFLAISNMQNATAAMNHLRMVIKTARDEYSLNQQIILPPLICSSHDIEHVTFPTPRPNFITSKKITGETAVLDGMKSKKNIGGKIVLIESADPGYDWIFTRPLIGLVTKYGGAASHMAIRCAEFGLPAAIGAGSLFDKLKTKRVLHLDCGSMTVE